MTNWLMKYNGEAVSGGRYKGFCIMTETDRCAYEKIVKTYFEERENTFLFIRKGAGILKIKTEQEFWKCIKWVPITTEETHILSELDLNDYGIYPSQEDFEYEIH